MSTLHPHSTACGQRPEGTARHNASFRSALTRHRSSYTRATRQQMHRLQSSSPSSSTSGGSMGGVRACATPTTTSSRRANSHASRCRFWLQRARSAACLHDRRAVRLAAQPRLLCARSPLGTALCSSPWIAPRVRAPGRHEAAQRVRIAASGRGVSCLLDRPAHHAGRVWRMSAGAAGRRQQQSVASA